MRFLLLAAALAAAVPMASARAATDPAPLLRSLSGVVTDPAGAPLAEVRVTVLELNRHTLTGPDGRYAIPELPTGTWGVSFSRIGYAPQVHRVTITSADLALDVRMRPSLVELPELQVTATPLATSALESPQPLSVVSGTDLENAQAPTLGATLDGLAGVRNYSTGQGIGKPVIRGLTSNRVLVLADGQRVESQQWGDEHGPVVGTEGADRIEVIRGPASVLYGSDAIGGVINVVERPLPDAIGQPPFLAGRVSGGFATNGEAPQGSLMLEGAAGAVGFRTVVNGTRSGDISTPDGELFNSGYRQAGGSGSVGIRGGWGSVRGTFGYQDQRIEIHEDPAEEVGATPFQRIANHRGSVSLDLPLGLTRLEVEAGYERNRRREFESNDDAGVALGLLSETWTGDAKLRHAPVGPFAGVVGASYVRTDVGKFGEETLVPESVSDGIGAFLYEATDLGPWRLSFGLRYDHRTLEVADDAALGVSAQERTYQSLTGNLGALYRVSEPVALVLNVGRGYRAPTPFDLFANGVHEGTLRFERGNPDLTNETSVNTDLAIRIQSDRLRAEVGGFVNLIDGYIYPDPTPEFDPESGLRIYDISQGDARLAGFEASAEYHPLDRVHLRGTADYTWGQNTTRDVPLAFVPPFRVTYGVRFEAPDRGWLHAPHVELSGETNAKQTRPDPDDVAPEGYSIFSLGGGFSIPAGKTEVVVDATIRNLFDREYRAFLSRYKLYAADPGRNLVVRVGMEF